MITVTCGECKWQGREDDLVRGEEVPECPKCGSQSLCSTSKPSLKGN